MCNNIISNNNSNAIKRILRKNKDGIVEEMDLREEDLEGHQVEVEEVEGEEDNS